MSMNQPRRLISIALPTPLDDPSDYRTWAHGVELILRANDLARYVKDELKFGGIFRERNDDIMARAIIFNSCSKRYQRWLPMGETTPPQVLWDLLREYCDACQDPSNTKVLLPSLDKKTYKNGHDFAVSYRCLCESLDFSVKNGVYKELVTDRFYAFVITNWPNFLNSHDYQDLKMHDVKGSNFDILRLVDTFGRWAKNSKV